MPGFPLPPLRGSGVYYICVRFSIFALLLTLSLAGTACYHGSKPSAIDRPAPGFKVQDSDHTVSLDQFKGKVVVLNFWASWCPPCIEELPSLMRMQTELQNKGVVVVGISVDSEPGDYEKFLKDHNVNFITALDPGRRTPTEVIAEVSAKYGTYQFPETYIIDRDGIVRRKLIGAVNFTQPEIVEYLSRL